MRLKTWCVVAVAATALLVLAAAAGAEAKVEVAGSGQGEVILPMDTFQKVTGWRPTRNPARSRGRLRWGGTRSRNC